jgi:hypothetical protein
MERNFLNYYKSINRELQTTKNRIRELIGSDHWLTDGEHKESFLRKVLRNHAPESVNIGRGFVCFADGSSSGQIDILITSSNKPTLYKDGELVIVTPDAVLAIIEVKSNQSSKSELEETLEKLADKSEKIRQASFSNRLWSGLFILENTKNINHIDVLSKIKAASEGNQDRIINCLAFGENHFYRFWINGAIVSSIVNDAVWHSYELQDLAQAYFISNLVWNVCDDMPERAQFAWFPIENGKETRRRSYISLNDDSVEPSLF